MKKYIDIVFSGDKFSPKNLKKYTKLPIECLVECGEIADRGRYKGTIYPYGLGVLKITPTDDINSSLINILDMILNKHSDSLYLSGEPRITIDIVNYGKSAIFDISDDVSTKIKSLNIPLDFYEFKD